MQVFSGCINNSSAPESQRSFELPVLLLVCRWVTSYIWMWNPSLLRDFWIYPNAERDTFTKFSDFSWQCRQTVIVLFFRTFGEKRPFGANKVSLRCAAALRKQASSSKGYLSTQTWQGWVCVDVVCSLAGALSGLNVDINCSYPGPINESGVAAPGVRGGARAPLLFFFKSHWILFLMSNKAKISLFYVIELFAFCKIHKAPLGSSLIES